MTKFNQDYKITISGDLNGNVYWELQRKGEPAVCNEDEIRMVAQVLGELKEKIKAHEPSTTSNLAEATTLNIVYELRRRGFDGTIQRMGEEPDDYESYDLQKQFHQFENDEDE